MKDLIESFQDFPEPGVDFKDLTPLFADPDAMATAVEMIAFSGWMPTIIAGIEARGFILGAAVAQRLGIGFVPLRKPGKTPGIRVSRVAYELEYGHASLELNPDRIPNEARVLIVDDVLATGGTLGAAYNLVHFAKPDLVRAACLVEIEALGGRDRLIAECGLKDVTTLIQY